MKHYIANLNSQNADNTKLFTNRKLIIIENYYAIANKLYAIPNKLYAIAN